MNKKITDYIKLKPVKTDVVLIQARVDASLRDRVLQKMKSEGVSSIKDLIEASFKSYLKEKVAK